MPGADTTSVMRGRYVIAVAILGAYFIASYLIVHNAIATQRSIARTVGVSGQQRMYAQRIAMFAGAMVARPGTEMRERAHADLERSIDTFTRAHLALTRGDAAIGPQGWPPESVRRMFFEPPYDVDQQVRDYLAHAKSVAARFKTGVQPGDSDLEYLLSVGPGPLLESLDAVVKRYNIEQSESVQKFDYLQLGVLLLGLSTLAIIWFTIFVPLEREIAMKTAALQLSATQDPLTALLNRSAFAERVEQSLHALERGRAGGAMLMIDLDRFKTINDTYGHVIGDLALVRCAEILRANARTRDVITRLGGDEFAIFVPGLDRSDELEDFVERLCTALQYELQTLIGIVSMSASIGVARYPLDAANVDALLHNSDIALYAAKASGRSTFRYCAVDAVMA
ncbi:MAG: hypothetical protein NVS2B17_18500 [Candidatus Velthaea sp.]